MIPVKTAAVAAVDGSRPSLSVEGSVASEALAEAEVSEDSAVETRAVAVAADPGKETGAVATVFVKNRRRDDRF